MKLKLHQPIEAYMKRVQTMIDKLETLATFLSASIDSGALYDYTVNIDIEAGDVCIATQQHANTDFTYTTITI